MNGAAPAGDANQPLASRAPIANSQPPYYFQFTFLQPGTYTVAFTCQAGQDDPLQADPAVKFNPIDGGIAVTTGQTTTVDIS
jgi:hypothetical protein